MIPLLSNSLHGTVDFAYSGVETLAGGAMEVWRVTFGLILHKMVGVAARRWEWLGGHYQAHPYAVQVAAVAVVAGLFFALIYWFKEALSPRAQPPQNPRHLNLEVN